jgi:hypothetical protein
MAGEGVVRLDDDPPAQALEVRDGDPHRRLEAFVRRVLSAQAQRENRRRLRRLEEDAEDERRDHGVGVRVLVGAGVIVGLIGSPSGPTNGVWVTPGVLVIVGVKVRVGEGIGV